MKDRLDQQESAGARLGGGHGEHAGDDVVDPEEPWRVPKDLTKLGSAHVGEAEAGLGVRRCGHLRAKAKTNGEVHRRRDQRRRHRAAARAGRFHPPEDQRHRDDQRARLEQQQRHEREGEKCPLLDGATAVRWARTIPARRSSTPNECAFSGANMNRTREVWSPTTVARAMHAAIARGPVVGRTLSGPPVDARKIQSRPISTAANCSRTSCFIEPGSKADQLVNQLHADDQERTVLDAAAERAGQRFAPRERRRLVEVVVEVDERPRHVDERDAHQHRDDQRPDAGTIQSFELSR